MGCHISRWHLAQSPRESIIFTFHHTQEEEEEEEQHNDNVPPSSCWRGNSRLTWQSPCTASHLLGECTPAISHRKKKNCHASSSYSVISRVTKKGKKGAVITQIRQPARSKQTTWVLAHTETAQCECDLLLKVCPLTWQHHKIESEVKSRQTNKCS